MRRMSARLRFTVALTVVATATATAGWASSSAPPVPTATSPGALGIVPAGTPNTTSARLPRVMNGQVLDFAEAVVDLDGGAVLEPASETVLFVGGDFDSVNVWDADARSYQATTLRDLFAFTIHDGALLDAFDHDGLRVGPVGPAVDGRDATEVRALEVHEGYLYVGGNFQTFTRAGGVESPNMAYVDQGDTKQRNGLLKVHIVEGDRAANWQGQPKPAGRETGRSTPVDRPFVPDGGYAEVNGMAISPATDRLYIAGRFGDVNSFADYMPGYEQYEDERHLLRPTNFAALALADGSVDPDVYVTFFTGKPTDPGHRIHGQSKGLERVTAQLDDVQLVGDEDRLVVIGNFERMAVWDANSGPGEDPANAKLNQFDQDQVAVVGITRRGKSFRVNWRTTFYGDRNTYSDTSDAHVCRDADDDLVGQQPQPNRHYLVRSLAVGTDVGGDFMIIGSTGGPNEDPARPGFADLSANHDGLGPANDPPIGCAMVARFDVGTSGLDRFPDWYNATGGDSIYAVAVDPGTAVYAGGHQKFMSNEAGIDTEAQCTGDDNTSAPDPGGVIRRGIAALDPVDGSVLAWDPGRDPRGDRGVEALLVGTGGLWVGQDTAYFGYKSPSCDSDGPAGRIFTGGVGYFEPGA